jgi:uncharacterized damage-inducible protein DinB
MTAPPITSALAHGPTRSLAELAARYLDEYLAKIRFALERLPAERLWWRPSPHCNSAGNLVLHLCGNLTFWLLAGVGGEAFTRHRAAEFAAQDGPGGAELIARLAAVVARCQAVLRRLDEAALDRPLTIQGYATDVRGAVFHATEHMSYHTGQLLLLLKQALPADEPVELYPQHRGE